MTELAVDEAGVLVVPELALLAFREALNRGAGRRTVVENGKQHFVNAGGLYLTAITFERTRGDASPANFNAQIAFETDVRPYVFSADEIARVLQLFGGRLSGIRYPYGEQVHQVTVELDGTTGFDME